MLERLKAERGEEQGGQQGSTPSSEKQPFKQHTKKSLSPTEDHVAEKEDFPHT